MRDGCQRRSSSASPSRYHTSWPFEYASGGVIDGWKGGGGVIDGWKGGGGVIDGWKGGGGVIDG